ncbi:MAG: hypothetical protein U0165_13350 [Polyangiaceae bacterium]
MDPILELTGLIATLSGFAFAIGASSRPTPRRHKRILIDAFETGMHGKIAGRARKARRLLTSPITRTPCVAYSVVLQRRDRRSWVHLSKRSLAVDFDLDDGSATAHINTRGNPIFDLVRVHQSVRLVSDLDPGFPLHELFPDVSTDTLASRSFRLVESYLGPNDWVAVFGEGTRAVDATSSFDETEDFREAASARGTLTMHATRELELMISDDRVTWT